MQLYELEKRLTIDVKYLAKLHEVDCTNLYVNVQTSKGAFGHYSQMRWIDKGEHKDELTLNPEYFLNPLEVLNTILHELVHIYCKQNNIKDTSRNGYYHNHKFKEIATKFGLKCIAQSGVGWNTTAEGNKEGLTEINHALPYPITGDMARKTDGKKKVQTTSTPRRKAHVYMCPECGKIVKSDQMVALECMIDKTIMQLNTEDAAYQEWLDFMGADKLC